MFTTRFIIYLKSEQTKIFHFFLHGSNKRVDLYKYNSMSFYFSSPSQQKTPVHGKTFSVHLTVAVVALNIIGVVEQLHQQRDELSILGSVGDDVVRISEVAVNHGLDGGAQLPQQLPGSSGQLAACQRISIEGNMHSIITNCRIRVNTKPAAAVVKSIDFSTQQKAFWSIKTTAWDL